MKISENIELLTKEQFLKRTKELEGGHWTPGSIDSRWHYHRQCVELIKNFDITSPDRVLEMGTMGITCVKGSKTIDYAERWDFKDKKPDFLHDAREIPWPIDDKEFDLFIANRVYMHVVPNQIAAINEAMRISKKVIITVPEEYKNTVLPDSKGITYDDFVNVLGGVHPNIFIKNGSENFYYWDTENPSYLNIGLLMEPKVMTKYTHKQPSFFDKVKWKLTHLGK